MIINTGKSVGANGHGREHLKVLIRAGSQRPGEKKQRSEEGEGVGAVAQTIRSKQG